MKKLLLVIILILPYNGVFALENTVPNIMSYEGYQKNVEQYCKLKGDIPNKSELWGDWEKDSFITIDQVIYADISKIEDGNKKYKEYLAKIKANPGKIDTLSGNLEPAFLEKASYVYKETMGTIYTCAIMNAKIRIIDSLLTKIPTTQSNLKQKLTKQVERLRGKISADGCRNIANTSELSIKKSLLDNTTYQYCNYRQYLYYLENASKQSINEYHKTSSNGNNSGSSLLNTTDSIATKILQSSNKIRSEISHTKEVFPQAMVAFTEFEKTYASHIILEFILQDYIDLRDSLKRLLNPIGQVIYKASNAQSSGK